MDERDKITLAYSIVGGLFTSLLYCINKELTIAKTQRDRATDDARTRYEDSLQDDRREGARRVLPESQQ